MMNHESSPQSFSSRHGAAGVGLVEVLVAIAVLAFGMLGIAALQATALRSSQSSINRNEAVALSYAILDAMRANRSNALLGAYNKGTYDPDDDNNTSCIGAVPNDDGTLAGADLNHWFTRLLSPEGLGGSACAIIAPVPGIQNTFQVRVRWDDSRGDVGLKSGGPATKEETVTVSSL